jgi:hypothetical protein
LVRNHAYPVPIYIVATHHRYVIQRGSKVWSGTAVSAAFTFPYRRPAKRSSVGLVTDLRHVLLFIGGTVAVVVHVIARLLGIRVHLVLTSELARHATQGTGQAFPLAGSKINAGTAVVATGVTRNVAFGAPSVRRTIRILVDKAVTVVVIAVAELLCYSTINSIRGTLVLTAVVRIIV